MTSNAPHKVILDFDVREDNISIRWQSRYIDFNQATEFIHPYKDSLPLVLKALSAAQTLDEITNFQKEEQETIVKLGLWDTNNKWCNVPSVVGKKLYDSLGVKGQQNLDRISNYSKTQRIRTDFLLKFPKVPVNLAALPWELITDNENLPILFRRGHDVDSCGRYVEIDGNIRNQLASKPKLHLLALSPRYHLESVQAEEWNARREIWNDLKTKGLITYDEISPLTISALNEYINKSESNRPDIIHYFGHGCYTNDGYLTFDDGEGGVDRVSTQRLTSILGDVRLIVLCACWSAAFNEVGGLLTGIAPSLSLIVDAVVAMQLPMRADAAIQFEKTLYDELLVQEKSLQEAVSIGRRTLYVTARDGSSWYVPTLYIRSGEQRPYYLHPHKTKDAPSKRPEPDFSFF